MVAKFRNGGQACTAANRFYVHADVADEFIAQLGAEVEKLTVGPGADGAAIGPLISAAALDRVSEPSSRRPSQRVPASRTGAVLAGRTGALLPADRPGRRPGWRRDPARGDLRAGRARRDLDATRRSCSGWSTTPSTGSRRTSSPATSAAPCGSADDDRRRHGRHQPRPRLRSLRSVRRREAERSGPRGRPRRAPRVSGDAVPQRRLALLTSPSPGAARTYAGVCRFDRLRSCHATRRGGARRTLAGRACDLWVNVQEVAPVDLPPVLPVVLTDMLATGADSSLADLAPIWHHLVNLAPLVGPKN